MCIGMGKKSVTQIESTVGLQIKTNVKGWKQHTDLSNFIKKRERESETFTCCIHGPPEERQSPGCCQVWCCGRGSDLSATPQPDATESVACEEAASLKEADML